MNQKPTYKELEQRIKELEEEATGRKQTDEALRESEGRLRQVIDLVPHFIFAKDRNGRFILVNQSVADAYGTTVEELIGKTDADFNPNKDEVEHFLRDDLKVMDSGQPKDIPEEKITDSKGNIRILQTTKIPFTLSMTKNDAVLGVSVDITKVKHTEEALRESEKRYRLLADNVQDVIWTRGMDLRFTYVSPSILEQQGYTVKEAMAKTPEESWPPDSLKLVGEVLFEELEIENQEEKDLSRSRTLEVEVICKDGSTIWTEAKMSFLREQNGNPTGIIGVTRDISERKKTEAALIESEERYRQIVRHAPTGIYEIDYRKGKLISANDLMCEFTGYTHEELLSMNPLDLLTKDSKELYDERLKKIFAGEHVPESVEFKIRRRDGQEVWAVLNIRFVYEDGKIIGATVVAHDINDRKLMEEALRESEDKYRTVLEANPDPVVVYDIDGKVIYFNPAFTRIFGWSLEERLGKKMDLFVPEDTWPETKMMIEKVLAGDTFSGIETRRYNKKGKIIPVSISGAIYSDRDGQPLGSVINLRDISEQKKLEAQFQAAQKIEAIGTLAGGVAHDFNNLLMGIQGRTSLMLNDINLSDPHLEHLKGVEDYIKSATDLTKQLLGFAMGGKYEVKPADLNELVMKSSELFGRTKKEISIHTKFQEDHWTVEVDQSQIEQVLLNLYVNAWQSMPGGGELYLETENVQLGDRFVKPYELEPGKYIKISVSDTGVGMDKATLERVFEPFFTTKEMGRGTGLGLASAYGIIKNHGGIINVSSEKGKGAKFNMYLPASEKEVFTEKELSADILKGTETILLVDDEEMIIVVGKQLLNKLGYKVLVAKGGQAAIDLYEASNDEIDMVILDMIMPHMGGGETYDLLRTINPNIKILLSSGYSIDGQAAEIMKRGCNGFIQKPFDMKDLSQKIREIFDK